MKLSFKQFLAEAPLPSDWDENNFNGNKRVSFAKQIAYAKERAQKMGAGSSRVAFKIDYQGRPTILKIAKNAKGLAQNQQEADMLSDWYAKGLEVMIPLIDYDEVSSKPTWLHVEMARKANDNDFKKICGGTLADLMTYIAKSIGKKGYFGGNAENLNDPDENEFVNNMIAFCGNYDHPIADYGRLANWGVYNGHPVLIDVGLSSEILNTHYAR